MQKAIKKQNPENERFVVVAVWDEEAGVYYSKSNIIGLHIEADTLEEFEAILDECVAEFIIENHLTAHELASLSARELADRLVVKFANFGGAKTAESGFPRIENVAAG